MQSNRGPLTKLIKAEFPSWPTIQVQNDTKSQTNCPHDYIKTSLWILISSKKEETGILCYWENSSGHLQPKKKKERTFFGKCEKLRNNQQCLKQASIGIWNK